LASQSILLTEFIGAVRVAGCNSTALESRGEKKGDSDPGDDERRICIHGINQPEEREKD
jgi:hypothetical protein